MAAAAVVGAIGGGDLLGDDHVVGTLENCWQYPWWCQGQCAELNACRSGNTPIGDSNCAIEDANLRMCEIGPPPLPPPLPPIVIVLPPPACPAGQHPDGNGGCVADYVCGDDEIGGGSEECEECGAGQVPNPDGTACVTCDYGESGSGGSSASGMGGRPLNKERSQCGQPGKLPSTAGRLADCLQPFDQFRGRGAVDDPIAHLRQFHRVIDALEEHRQWGSGIGAETS